MNKKRGGALLKNNNTLVNAKFLLHYIANKNNKITYLTRSDKSLIFIIDLNDVKVPNFFSFELSTFLQPIKQLLVKINIIKRKEFKKSPEMSRNERDNVFKIIKKELGGVSLIDKIMFETEVRVQTNIFFKTCDYLQPICPGIIYADILEFSNVEDENKDKDKKNEYQRILIEKLIPEVIIDAKKEIGEFNGKNSKNNEIPPYEFTIKESDYANYVDFGINVMTYNNNYETLYDLHKNNKFNFTIYVCSLYILLELIFNTDHVHVDPHFGNIMYNSTDTTYFGKKGYGRPTIIDLGDVDNSYTFIVEKLKQEYNIDKNPDYLGFLRALYRKALVPYEKHDLYNWIFNTPYNDNEINEEIIDLFDRRKTQIQNNTTEFNSKEIENNPYFSPFFLDLFNIPLSEEIKIKYTLDKYGMNNPTNNLKLFNIYIENIKPKKEKLVQHIKKIGIQQTRSLHNSKSKNNTTQRSKKNTTQKHSV